MDWITDRWNELAEAAPWLTGSLRGIWDMATEAAPWLLIGLIAAAIVKAWVPKGFIVRQLGGKGVGGVMRASVVGIPLPLCSCGVLPTALGLRRQGASRPATTSFLVSTPEIGLDSIALSYVLLGPIIAIARPVAALFGAIAAGLAAVGVERWSAKSPAAPPAADPATDQAKGSGCCGGEAAARAAPAPPSTDCCGGEPTPSATSCCDKPAPATSCCGDEQASDACCDDGAEAQAPAPTGAMAKLGDGLRYVFSRLLDDIKWWLAIAIVVAGVLMGFFHQPAEVLQTLTTGVWAPLGMAAMVIIGIPLYVCATGSTPLAAGLLVAGISPGTVLVLLLAGPATNLGSVAILRRELGTATVAAYLLAISITAIAAGLLLDAMIGWFGWSIAAQTGDASRLIPEPIGIASAFILVVVAIPPARGLIGKAAGLFRRRATPRATATDPLGVGK